MDNNNEQHVQYVNRIDYGDKSFGKPIDGHYYLKVTFKNHLTGANFILETADDNHTPVLDGYMHTNDSHKFVLQNLQSSSKKGMDLSLLPYVKDIMNSLNSASIKNFIHDIYTISNANQQLKKWRQVKSNAIDDLHQLQKNGHKRYVTSVSSPFAKTKTD